MPPIATLPPPAGPARRQAGPSLVPPKSITHEIFEEPSCPYASWARAECEDHHAIRFVSLPCKRRNCPYCGYVRRRYVAARIDQGIVTLAGPRGAGYLCCTWDRDILKPEAVRKVTRLVAWVRRHQRARPEYALTWELTKAQRLHVNLLFAPWRYMAQADLSLAWERLTGSVRVWVERVGVGMSSEMAKSNNTPGWYFAKHEQMVTVGRSCAYSKGWPPLPSTDKLPRVGKLFWTPPWALQALGDDLAQFQIELYQGHWRECAPGWFANLHQEHCGCFLRRTPPDAQDVDPQA